MTWCETDCERNKSSFRFVLFVAAIFSTIIVHARETIQPGCDDRSAGVLQECIDAMGGMSLVEAANLKLSGNLLVKLKIGKEEFVVNGETELVQMGDESRRPEKGVYNRNEIGRLVCRTIYCHQVRSGKPVCQ